MERGPLGGIPSRLWRRRIQTRCSTILRQGEPADALGASIDRMRPPCLSKLASISNAGLSEIQPDTSRGRARYLVLVSDSYTVFLAGKNTSADLAGDLIEQTATGVFSQYRAPSTTRCGGKHCRCLWRRPRQQSRTCGPVFSTRRGRRRSRSSGHRLAWQRAGCRTRPVLEPCLRFLARERPRATCRGGRLERGRGQGMHIVGRTRRP